MRASALLSLRHHSMVDWGLIIRILSFPSLFLTKCHSICSQDIEGQNLKVEYRYLPTGGASAETLAAELVKLNPDDDDRGKTSDQDDPYRNGARPGCGSRGYRHEPRPSRR